MNDFKFNDLFEQKLGSDKQKFINNLKKAKRFNKERLKFLDRLDNFENFIISSFIWKKSNEGDQYWRDISKR